MQQDIVEGIELVTKQEIVNDDGWLSSARRAPSPHFNERPADGRITLVVVHGVSLPPDEFGGPWVEDFFTGMLDFSAHPYFESIRDLRVSPHLFIRRDGEVVQFVSFLDRAWHAGRSSWNGREECNDYAIGVELEGNDVLPYPDAQYRALVAILARLMDTYPGILEGGIVGHCHVSPERKTDPGASFDWCRLDELLIASGYNLPSRITKAARGNES